MKLFLKELDGSITISNEVGLSISFIDGDEFTRLTGSATPAYDRMVYEPPIYFIKGYRGPNIPEDDGSVYEDHIENVQVYLDRRDDLYYGLWEAQRILKKKLICIQLIKIEAQASFKVFVFNEKIYEMSLDIHEQIKDIHSMLVLAIDDDDDLTTYFPVSVEMGIDEEGLPEIKQVYTLNIFKSVYKTLINHVAGIKRSTNEAKQSIKDMTTEDELDAFIASKQ